MAFSDFINVELLRPVNIIIIWLILAFAGVALRLIVRQPMPEGI
jgi:hypothetical protein